MDIERKQILETFLRIIGHISDKKYQKRVWIRGEGPECDDFDETCCNFFGDCEGVLGKYNNYGITEDQYLPLKKFRDEFETFSDENHWPQIFIDTPEWEKIMEMAKEVLEAFNYQKGASQNTKFIKEDLPTVEELEAEFRKPDLEDENK